jgi:hypothetical protein
VGADKAAREFTASIALGYWLATRNVKLYGLNCDYLGVDRWLKHKKRLRALWEDKRDPERKRVVNGLSKTIRRKTCKRALNDGKQKWLTLKSLKNKDGPRAPTTIHCPLGLKFHPLEKANAISDCLEKQFTPHHVTIFLMLEGPMFHRFRSLRCPYILLALGRWPDLPKCPVVYTV